MIPLIDNHFFRSFLSPKKHPADDKPISRMLYLLSYYLNSTVESKDTASSVFSISLDAVKWKELLEIPLR